MIKQKHSGFAIFGICSALSARLALFEPPPPPQEPSLAEQRWGTHQTDNSDPLGLIHSVRYYIYGIGIVGLLIVVEDHFNDRTRPSNIANEPPAPSKVHDATKPEA
jgi:hypothetical protein